MRHTTRARQLAGFSLLGLLVACGSTADPSDEGSGGSSAGGVSASGSSSTAGSSVGSGGVASVGGSASTAGAPNSSGGQPQATGGNGGTTAEGGTTSGGKASGGMSGGGMSGGGKANGGGSGGMTSGDGTGTAGGSSGGEIRITDKAPGFASMTTGTTGGGTDISKAVTVNSMSALQAAAKGSNAAIILVEPGNYAGSLSLGSNKTIIGKAPGVTITGSVNISGSNVSNVIIRNLAVRGERCSNYEECKAGDDAVYMGSGAHHIWLDHLDIADGQDGNCDATQGADYITVSWSHFHYTYAKEHSFSNLIAGSDDEPNSVGKLKMTYMNCHWGERVDQRQPRGRFGDIHMLNNYHNTGGGQIHGVGKDMAMIAENCVYDEKLAIFKDMGSPRGWKGMGNQGTASDMNSTKGTVFTVPYPYTPMPASAVVAAVTSPNCGSGNTCRLGN